MPKRPGGVIASRPLNFFWLCDCSGSMSDDGKIETLNQAIREALPEMRDVAEKNPGANVLLRTLRFSHGAEWHDPKPIALEEFEWQDLEADPLQGGIKADIVFLVDTSGSMSDEIDAVKHSCQSFAEHIEQFGAQVRLGLVGFDIGGHQPRMGGEFGYEVHQLSTYTIGIWPLTDPPTFRRNAAALRVGLFGGAGCYLADNASVDIFPHVVSVFDGAPDSARILVIISDEIGSSEGVPTIVRDLQRAGIVAHVLGVPYSHLGAHESIAAQTGGKFWDIHATRGAQDFSSLLETVAVDIGREISRQLANGSTSAGTDMGAAFRLLAEELAIPPMAERALPPVAVLISDGHPTDDADEGLEALMELPWARKAIRLAIAIGQDADLATLQKFIARDEIRPLLANNPAALVAQIHWASTAALQTASAPPAAAGNALPPIVTMPESVDDDLNEAVW